MDIVDISDAQTSLALLRACMGICQVNYVLRTVPPTATRRQTRLFDTLTHDVLNELTKGAFSQDKFMELQLPTRPINDEIPTFRLGLPSAVSAAATCLSGFRNKDQTPCDTNGTKNERGGS